MYVCFYVLGSTADGYLSPLLANIAKTLKFSQSLAGVTLLAFGNGAPDVFSALSAAEDATSTSEGSGEGFYLAAAGSLGSGFFVASIVASAIALQSSSAQSQDQAAVMFLGDRHRQQGSIAVNPSSFVRDAVFYMVTMLILAYAMFIRERFDLAMSVAFLLLYSR
jgi:Ca2+/Na+ antiporter